MLTDEQKAFLVLLLGQFREDCPHWADVPDAQKNEVDDIVKLLTSA